MQLILCQPRKIIYVSAWQAVISPCMGKISIGRHFHKMRKSGLTIKFVHSGIQQLIHKVRALLCGLSHIFGFEQGLEHHRKQISLYCGTRQKCWLTVSCIRGCDSPIRRMTAEKRACITQALVF